MSINRASSSFTHKLELKYGSTLIATRTGIGASTTFTLTTAEENTLYSAMKNVTSGTVTMYCTTYQGSTKIGSTTSKTATASVGSSIVPSFDTITHSDVSTDIASVFGAYIQGKSRLNLAITGAAGAKYSTITSYKIEFNQEVYNSRTAVSGYIKGYGNIPIKGTVTDSRGRSYSKTIAINVLAYAPPKISSFRVDRCNSDGTLNPSGEYAKVTISGECKSLNSKNTIQLTISSKTRNVSSYTTKHTDTPAPTFTEEYIIGTYDTSVSYDFRARLEDYFEKAESTVVLGTAKVVFHLGREGIGAGKVWEQGALDVAGNVYINNKKPLLRTYYNGWIPLNQTYNFGSLPDGVYILASSRQSAGGALWVIIQCNSRSMYKIYGVGSQGTPSFSGRELLFTASSDGGEVVSIYRLDLIS